LIEELRNAHMAHAALLYAPSVDLDRIVRESGAPSTRQYTGRKNLNGNWVDIEFWIGPDGKVRDAELLRSEGATGWTSAMLTAIRGRIYAPVDAPTGSYRVDRYSYLARWVEIVRAHGIAREPRPDIQFIDLTADPSRAAKP
jgi:hypothetical protein